jgi:hypothetical protein
MHLNFDQLADATQNKHPLSEHERRLQAREGDGCQIGFLRAEILFKKST